MATVIESDQLVPLRGGPTVPLAAVSWLIEAEFRGLTLRVEADGRLFAGPRSRVTADDLAFIHKYRVAVIAALDYIAQQEVQPQ